MREPQQIAAVTAGHSPVGSFARGRALFVSIPKCGKNLIRSYFDALGLRRVKNDADIPDAVAHVYGGWLTRRDDADGENPDDLRNHIDATEPAYWRLVDTFSSLPDGRFIHGHFAYDDHLAARAREAGLPVVFLYRDPRACLASMAHFLVKRGEPQSLARRLVSRDVETAVRLLVEPSGDVSWFEDVYAPYFGWLRAEGTLAVRFEDLVGVRGGGSADRQLVSLAQVASHIGWQGDPWSLTSAMSRAFNPRATTFRRGTVDGWRHDLPATLTQEDVRRLDGLVRRWGYATEAACVRQAVSEQAVSELVSSLMAEHAAERERLSRTRRELEAQRVEVERLQVRVETLVNRRAVRTADAVGRAIHAVAHVLGRPSNSSDAGGGAAPPRRYRMSQRSV